MDEPAAAAAAAGRRYVEWEEVVVSHDRGRRVVHYYLLDEAGGARELAVVGRERSLRHMTYAVPGRFLRALAAVEAARAPSPSRSPAAAAAAQAAEGASLKWRSRREVVDWLSSIVSGKITQQQSNRIKSKNNGQADSARGSSSITDRSNGFSCDDDDDDDLAADVPASKDLSSIKVGHNPKDFAWLGSAWDCRKRRKHYRSFCRKGITISVHDFVYIMSEEKKRLVAYVEDLYEDMRANNVVVVRWFHKVHEVGVQVPSDVGEREIFFSLCLQDFSVECIDGLAAVLSAQHFEKFQKCATRSRWQPYLCRRQIDNDDVKPFDITQVQGYWSQELLRTMLAAPSSLKFRFKVTSRGSGSDGGHKRKHDEISDGNHGGKYLPSSGCASDLLKNVLKYNLQQQLYPGCHAEVMSQDSGIRGCWFRCLIMKRHRDKIKVRYQDLQDADETGNLEEWVLLTRVAAPDQLGLRLSGRPMVRPHYLQRSKVPCSFAVGAIVDAWWHNGWWEGIVIRRETEGRMQVYFPEEKRVSEFGQSELRHSLDWVGNAWSPLKERKDIACQLTPNTQSENKGLPSELNSQVAKLPPISETGKESVESNDKEDGKSADNRILPDRERDAADLANALKFDNLKWSARKRRRYGMKRQSDTSSGSSQEETLEFSPCGGSVLLDPMAVDQEVCKIGSDPLFSAPMTVSSLVMSR